MEKLYILPFDHRGSFKKMFLGHGDPISAEETEKMKELKRVIFDGLKKSITPDNKKMLGVLVDEEFGESILHESTQIGLTTILTTEKSGNEVFEFDYPNWREHVEAIKPTYIKALIRVNPALDNSLQNSRLKEITDYAAANGYKFLLEPLVFATDADLQKCGGDLKRFDKELRTDLFVQMVAQCHDAGVMPDIWKIEGTETREDMERSVAAVKSGGKAEVGIVVLGRGESFEKVEEWLTTSASVDGVIGFAVGRTIFAEALHKMVSGEYTADQASDEIRDRFVHFIGVFEKGR